MALRAVSTPASGNGTSISIAKPAGVAAGDIVIAFFTTDVSGKTFSTPSGFTAFTANGQAAPDGHSNQAFWRRFDGSEGANITSTVTGGGDDWIAHAIALSGRHASDAPVATLTTPNTTANSSPVSVALTGVTAVSGDDIVWWGALDNTSSAVAWSFTPPTNYTEGSDTTLNWCAASLAYRLNVSSGATGTLTGTATGGGGQAGYAGYVVRVPAAAGGGASITGTGAMTAGTSTASGTGVRGITGTGAIQTAVTQVTGSSPTGGAITGSGALSKGGATVTGAGSRGTSDTPGPAEIAVTTAATASGTGTAGHGESTGTGALTKGTPTIVGTGTKGVHGTGVLQCGVATVSGGTGPRAIIGTGAITCNVVTVSGTGVRHVTSTGALTANAVIVNGTGAGVTGGSGFGRLSHFPTRMRSVRSAHGRPRHGRN